MKMDENNFPYEKIVDLMKVSYNMFGDIPFDLIDTMVSYLIQVNVRGDNEFKLVLGEGYYK
jgi:hypothetical protein